MITITQQKAEFHANYDVGWTGFITREDDFIAAGIAWDERWDNISHVPVIHTFKITGQDETVEAFSNGVAVGSLTAYLDNPKVKLFTRCPNLLTPELGQILASRAKAHIGDKYDDGLIAADAFLNSYVGKLLDRASAGELKDRLTAIAARPREEICSQLVAIADSVPELEALGGYLTNPAATIKPIDIFEDLVVYREGAYQLTY